jgi:predicted Rossmann fold flavoprotein
VEYDVIIVGAGASGLMAAIAASRQGSTVLVIERKDKAGKKILATGNGKCNFSNIVQKPECYRSNDSAFAMKVLSCFDVQQTLEFFEELGIYPKNRDGYLYPNSEQASSVVSVLLMECHQLKVNFEYNSTVVDIKKPYYTVIAETVLLDQEEKKPQNYKNKGNKKSEADSKFTHKTVMKTYHGKKLIVTTGGCASPQLGSDGSGYALAKQFGHTIIKPLPALVQLKSPEKYCKTVSGVRTNAKVTALQGQKQLTMEEGEILFTDYGISGIPILQLSRYVAKELDKGEPVHLLLDFIPELTKESLETLLIRRVKHNQDKNIEEMLVGLLHHKLAYVILLESKIDYGKKSNQLTRQEIERLVRLIKELKMKISDTNSFENAQVSAGGINTKEIDASSMESKLSKNLYFAGEIIDVDGTCGGYNLQWAWSSGYIAGTAAGKTLKEQVY